MKPSHRPAMGVLLAFLAACAAPLPAGAVPISYVFEGVGSGTAGTRAFAGTPFTITATADTSQVEQQVVGVYRVYSVPVSARVDIAGVGEGAILTPVRLFSNVDTSPPGLGLSRMPLFSGTDLLDVSDPTLAGYDLRGPFGPLLEEEPFRLFNDLASDLGLLTFTDIDRVTFRAVVVPEPAGAVVFLLTAGAALLRRRNPRRRQ